MTARPAPPPESLAELAAGEAVAAMVAGRFGARDYAEALLAQAEDGAGLGAFQTLDPAHVRAAADAADSALARGEPPGRLHGLPIPVKDSVATAGITTTAGTRALASFVPQADAAIVERLKAAGAYVMGKTAIHELSLGWTSDNQAFGPVRNPWDPARIPGGSTGGSAAAVAARMAPLALAEDTQGSIRVPAALCGIAGFRPTTGRYPSAGTAPISPLFDQVGPLARCVADLQLFDHAIAGAPPLPPLPAGEIRLGMPRGFFFDGVADDVAAVVEAAFDRLRAAGVTLVETEIAGFDDLFFDVAMPIQMHDLGPSLRAWLAEVGAPVTFAELVDMASDDIAAVIRNFATPDAGGAVPEARYRQLVEIELPRRRAAVADWFAAQGVAAMVFPTTLVTAPRIGDLGPQAGSRELSFFTAIARNITPGSSLGLPGLVLPAGLSPARLPVSLELDGPAGSDARLLAIGATIEAIMGSLPRP
ncbi:hypothetical protein IP88_08145 [alpha proteobacterium AAP81b]|nr:hypothetical protein IP88_08145 [alpha proteobacterium AAP81b]